MQVLSVDSRATTVAAAAKLTVVGRAFFALGLIGLGVTHFIHGDFMTGRAPAWPASAPGGLVWAYATGAAFIAIGIAVLVGKGGRLAALFAAALILGWALLRNIPVVAADSLFGGLWTRGGKSLVFTAGALAVAATLPAVDGGRDAPLYLRFMNLRREFIAAGRFALAFFLVLTGIQHFMFTAFVASLIPAWFPGDPVFWTYFAAVALLAGGIGLAVPLTARLAALLAGVMVFSWFWIVHLPRTLMTVSDGIAVFEALVVAGLAFVLAGALGPRPSG